MHTVCAHVLDGSQAPGPYRFNLWLRPYALLEPDRWSLGSPSGLSDESSSLVRRPENDDEVNRLGHITDGVVTLLPENAVRIRINWDDIVAF